MKTLKHILLTSSISCFGCAVLCAVANIIQGINLPSHTFTFAGVSMLVFFLGLEDLHSKDDGYKVCHECFRSDIAAINARISDLLMPGGAKAARHEMLKQWILAHFIEAAGKARIDFTQSFTASFSYKYGGKWAMSTVKVPPGNLANDLFESVLGPYADMMASIVMEGRDWDLFDFDPASAFFEEYHDPKEDFVSVHRNV